MSVKNKYLFLCFLLNIFVALSGYVTVCEPVVTDEAPIVKIPDFGTFRGAATISLQRNRTIYQFLGLPYAVPPMGFLRFKVN